MSDNCQDVGSSGSLNHFVKKNRPVGASDRCLDCQARSTCPRSACKIYLGEDHKCISHFRRVPTAGPSEESVCQALRDGSYGCCVYRCGNDVMGHQVVNLRSTHQ